MDLLAATADPDAARPIWRELQRLMMREAPVTVLYYPRPMAAVSARLQGVEIRRSAPWVSAPGWWILPSERR